MAQPSAWSSGLVTAPPGPPSAVPPAPPDPGDDPERRRRRQLMIFGGIAGAILVVGLAVLLVVALTSSDGHPFSAKAKAPDDLRPPLAKACPAPTTSPRAEPTRQPSVLPPPTGARTVDPDAGISYEAYGDPWVPWVDVWQAGTLKIVYKKGQHFVTEVYGNGKTYHASILSGAVPAANNDALTLDLQCVGHQVAADVRASYYPLGNTLEPIKEELTTFGGRPAWFSEFRLHFTEKGLRATDELVGVAVIDVGKPTAAILYVSIPGTHQEWDHVVDEVMRSVRPT